MNQIKLSVLKDYSSIEEFLKQELLFSKAQIKKTTLSKKFLTRSLKAKDEISLPENLVNRGMINPNYDGGDVEILLVENDFIVFNKPFGMHGHALSYEENKTLLNYMRKNLLDKSLGLASTNQERGLLYRLDEVTSGVLFYIKDETLFNKMRENFSEVGKEKVYLAIVSGKFDKEGTHLHYFSSKGPKAQKVTVSDLEKDGMPGELEVSLEQYNEEDDLSLVKVKLKTGLRHQIRAQLAYIGYPLLGDSFYDGRDEKRVFLHAYSYKIKLEDFEQTVVCSRAELFDKYFKI